MWKVVRIQAGDITSNVHYNVHFYKMNIKLDFKFRRTVAILLGATLYSFCAFLLFQKSLVESGYFVKWDLVTKALYILDSNWRIKQQFLLPLVVKEVT